VDYAIPGITCVVDDDVDLTAAEVCGLLDQRVDVFIIEHVSRDGEGLAAVLVDSVCDALCFFCGGCVSLYNDTIIATWLYGLLMSLWKGKRTNRHRYRSQRL
jgi:hypothetical protein